MAFQAFPLFAQSSIKGLGVNYELSPLVVVTFLVIFHFPSILWAWVRGSRPFVFSAFVILYIQLVMVAELFTPLEFSGALIMACYCGFYSAWRVKMRDLCENLAELGHEMKAPLACIAGYSQLIIDDSGISQDSEFAKTILKNSQYLLGLTESYIEKIKSAKNLHSAPFQTFNLLDFHEDIRKIFLAHCAEKNIGLVIEFDKNLPHWVEGQSASIRQVIINLLNNAVRYTERGEIKLSVMFDAQKGLLVWQIKDTGVGIPQPLIGKIFDRFFRCPFANRVNPKGVGIGLNVSQKLVNSMGGVLAVQSIEGEGSVFSFSLPLNRIQIVDSVVS